MDVVQLYVSAAVSAVCEGSCVSAVCGQEFEGKYDEIAQLEGLLSPALQMVLAMEACSTPVQKVTLTLMLHTRTEGNRSATLCTASSVTLSLVTSSVTPCDPFL